MTKKKYRVSFIGAGTIATALGNILAETCREDILLHSVEPETVRDINQHHVNTKYFPAIPLHPGLHASTSCELLRESEFIFLAIPSVVMVEYLQKIKNYIPQNAVFVNLAKGFGSGSKTIVQCLEDNFPNHVFTLKGPSFAREIINRLPTGFTLGYRTDQYVAPFSRLFEETNIHLDYSQDMTGVEVLSILKNIYAVVIGIVDAQFNSPNLRFLILTKAFREMKKALLWFGGNEETLFNYCGYGDFSMTALNDLSRNRTLGLLIGKGFFTEHISHELVLEGKTAVNIFYSELSAQMDTEQNFPMIAELHKIFSGKYDVSRFVTTILDLKTV